MEREINKMIACPIANICPNTRVESAKTYLFLRFDCRRTQLCYSFHLRLENRDCGRAGKFLFEFVVNADKFTRVERTAGQNIARQKHRHVRLLCSSLKMLIGQSHAPCQRHTVILPPVIVYSTTE